MKRTTTTLMTALAAGALLAACSPKPDGQTTAATEPAAAPAAAAPASDMAKMDMPAETKMAKGTGTVTAIDPATSAITIDHAPIPEANWPAMTMGFKATSELAKSVKVGDKVAFDLVLKDGGGEITAIQPQ